MNPTFLSLIKNFEGIRLTSYPDPFTGGVPWTIGYGTTQYLAIESHSGNVQKGQTITESEAEIELQAYVEKRIIPTLSKSIPTWDKMNSNQKGAIISFAYNLGENFYGSNNFNTITRALSTVDNFVNVPQALMLYVNPGSIVEAGLRRRRKAEGDLFKTKDSNANPNIHRDTIDFFKVIEFFKEEPHQQESLIWLFKQYPQEIKERIARLWNPNSDVVFNFLTYCRFYQEDNPAHTSAINLLIDNSPSHFHGFYAIWRKKFTLVELIIQHMENKGFDIFRNNGEVNIAYVESSSFIPNTFNDDRIVFGFRNTIPVNLGQWSCTTTPGNTYTQNPLNSKGAAMVVPGQHYAWQIGTHKRANHRALVQTGGEIKVYRDFNRDYKRSKGEIIQSGYFGINQHSTKPGYSRANHVGGFSAGCLVGLDWNHHMRFMNIVESDPRVQKNRKMIIPSTLILEEEM